MIHIFNRAEVLFTYDLEQFNRAKDSLALAGIGYTYRTKDLTSPSLFAGGSRTRAGTWGVNHDARIEYKLYVQRSDLARARGLL